MSTKRCVLIGAGGHASVLLDCVDELVVKIVGVVDSNPDLWRSSFHGYEVIGGDSCLVELAQTGVCSFLLGVGGSTNLRIRTKLFEQAVHLGLRPIRAIHSTAICSKRATIHEGCQLLPGCIVNAGTTIGTNSIINSAAVVEHDCQIAAHVHIAPNATLAGGVSVGEGAFIGAGAVIRQGISIGRNTIVAAGAVVVKDVPSDTMVVGVPAKRVIRA